MRLCSREKHIIERSFLVNKSLTPYDVYEIWEPHYRCEVFRDVLSISFFIETKDYGVTRTQAAPTEAYDYWNNKKI